MILYTSKHKIAFQIDSEFQDKVCAKIWNEKGGYIATQSSGSMYLHIFLFGQAIPGLKWDHINRDRKDNRRNNLRQVTKSIDVHNRGINRNNSSGFTGVSPSNDGRWKSEISIKGIRYKLGIFISKEDARTAYLLKLKEHYPEL